MHEHTLAGPPPVAAAGGTGKVHYGIDAPYVVGWLLLGGLLGLGAGIALLVFGQPGGQTFAAILCVIGIVDLALWTSMFSYARLGKFRHRDHLLGMVPWRGDEQVLDIGTGRGLMMIGAAKHLTTGRSVGIDIWNASDLSGNAIENTRRNIASEGVQDRAEVRLEDVRRMSFADASFDVILSLMCLHNISGGTERAKACREIARVLKPGGIALLSDYRHAGAYTAALREAGLTVEPPKSDFANAYFLVWTVVARKRP
jgi:SAM-dependent methyltransferase